MLDTGYLMLGFGGWFLDARFRAFDNEQLLSAALFLKAVSNRESTNRLSVSRLFFTCSPIFILEVIGQPLKPQAFSETGH